MRLLLFTIFNVIVFQSVSYGQDTINYFPDSSRSGQKIQGLNLNQFKVADYGTPTLLLSYGFLSLENKPVQNLDKYVSHELLEADSNLSTRIDDYLRYVPVIVVYSLNILGVKGKNNLFDRTAIYLISNMFTSQSIDFLKDKTHKQRPSQGDFRSFPSGHTALAFGAAEFMRLEYKDRSPWYGYAAYSLAAATGALKMLKNEHWLSDVLAGAGIGILSTKASYLLYPWVKKKIAGQKDLKFRSMPFVERGVVGYSIIVPIN